MRVKRTFGLLIVLLVATGAAAQNKVVGTVQCGKPDPTHTVAVGDRPDHSFMISQFKCTWSKPFELAGIQSKEGSGTQFDEVSGNTSRFHGYYMDTMATGDKVHYRYDGAAILKEGAIQSAEDKWSSVRGTGKFKGIKAKGTCKGKAGADGSTIWDCEGEWQLPSK